MLLFNRQMLFRVGVVINGKADVFIAGFDAGFAGLLTEWNTNHGQPGFLLVRADDHHILLIETYLRWLNAIADRNHRQAAGNTLL